MSLVPNRAIEGAAGNQGYNIQRSLRFRSSASAYLNRTPASASNRQKFTISRWIKRGKLGATDPMFCAGTSTATEDRFMFAGNDTLLFDGYSGGSTVFYMNTISVYRDPSAWYNVIVSVDTTQATASNRILLYVNGVQITSFATATYPVQNASLNINNNIAHYIGTTPDPYYADSYAAEVNFIDGQALTPSSFGQTDPVTGVWQPKKYTGTYGTNGFYLPFSDNTSATTLAYDKSGNGNNWTANNISTTAGSTYDSMLDVPTLTSATAANYCVLNPTIAPANRAALSNGNLDFTAIDSTSTRGVTGTFYVSSGKYYWESVINTSPGGSYYAFGITSSTGSNYVYMAQGSKWIDGSNQGAYGATWGNGDIIGAALDMDAGTLAFYKNGVSQGTAFTGLSGSFAPRGVAYGATDYTGNYNFGQRPFSYTPPTGFKALNTFNLPDPTIKKPNQYMDATTYTGNGNPNNTTQTITNSGSMQPDFVWIKSRSNAYNNSLFDSVRGVANTLASNSTAAEDTTGTTMLTALNSNGFTVGSNLNGSLGSTNVNGATYVGWQWKESATSGFDIVTYTGNGANRTVAHNLGVAPKMIIVKNRSGVYDWRVYVESIGAGNILLLNTTAASTASSTSWNSTAPTSSVFSIGTAAGVNNNGDNFVAYLFAEIAGFSKFGSYTGNGSTDGPFVYCGFRPRYFLIKNTSTTTNWIIYDTARQTYNTTNPGPIYANLSSAEESNVTLTAFDVLSNGFKPRNTSSWAESNASGNTYIYAAFAENPFKYANAR